MTRRPKKTDGDKPEPPADVPLPVAAETTPEPPADHTPPPTDADAPRAADPAPPPVRLPFSKNIALMTDVDPRIDELNEKHALVVENGKVTIITERIDAEMNRFVLDRSSAADFRLLYRNREVHVGKRTVPLGDHWLEHPLRRQYKQLVFDPSSEVAQPEVYNLWRGWAYTPKPGDWSLFKAHLLNVGAAGDEDIFRFIMEWLALLIQYPHIPPGVALVWRGNQGTGKGFIARTIGKLCGQHFVHVANIRHLTGHFNAHLYDALLVFADEAFWAGDKASEGALKAIITEPTMMLERKGRDSVVFTNRTHLMVATNNDWAVPMNMDDRRFNVVDVPDTHQQDRAYFGAIRNQMDEGGYQALMWELMTKFVDPTQPLRVPQTETSIESGFRQKLMTMSPEDHWWFDTLRNGVLLKKKPGHAWGEAPVEELYADYLEALESVNAQRPQPKAVLGLYFQRRIPGFYSSKRRAVGNWSERVRYWCFPSLALCRESFAKYVKHPHLFTGIDDVDGDDD